MLTESDLNVLEEQLFFFFFSSLQLKRCNPVASPHFHMCFCSGFDLVTLHHT